MLYAGETIREIDLVASMDAKRSVFAFIGTLAKSIFSSWIFKIVAAAVIIALVVMIIIRRKKNKTKAAESRDYRILNYNDFMKLKK